MTREERRVHTNEAIELINELVSKIESLDTNDYQYNNFSCALSALKRARKELIDAEI